LIERISDILGWIGGVATVYWTLGVGAVGAVWAASWLVRSTGRLVIGLAS